MNGEFLVGTQSEDLLIGFGKTIHGLLNRPPWLAQQHLVGRVGAVGRGLTGQATDQAEVTPGRAQPVADHVVGHAIQPGEQLVVVGDPVKFAPGRLEDVGGGVAGRPRREGGGGSSG